MVLMTIMVYSTESAFHRVSPILWRDTGKPVLVGVTPVHMAIKYQSPCELLTEPSILPSGSQAQLFEWCNTTYHASFMRPVKKWCRPSKFSPEVTNRKKRIAVAAIVGLGAIAIGAATSVGLSAVALTKVSTLSGGNTKTSDG
jgi:hypothetical protein